jgi:hypothetical protein
MTSNEIKIGSQKGNEPKIPEGAYDNGSNFLSELIREANRLGYMKLSCTKFQFTDMKQIQCWREVLL